MDNQPLAVTDETFQEEVLNHDLPVLVDFWAEWSSCSISCGGEGKRSRTRYCATEDFRHNLQFSGIKFCADNPGTQLEPCFTPHCERVMDSLSHEPYRTR